jgi:hypothetical protein
MSLRPEEIDLYRHRWREARRHLRLIDPLSEDFGTGGLARHAPEVHVRFLVLPPDPDAAAAQFDQDFWAWWMQDRPNPFEGASPTNWGRESLPEATAAVRYERWTDDRWNWNGYLALHRSGGLEFGLGRLGSTRWRRGQEEDETHVFFLTTIVGRVWLGLALFAEVEERFAIEGPWEITLALHDAEQAVIGNVAAGWAEPERAFPPEELSQCPDPNVLIVRELQEWPDPEGQQMLAFDIGSNIEDAFGVRERRFLGRVDPAAGMFDPSRYRSGR